MRNERSFTTAAHHAVRKELPGFMKITKHSDRFTKDIPDSSFMWNGHTTWVEFKRLGPTESIHDQIRVGQILDLIDRERAAPGHALALAYRVGNSRHPNTTELYYPPALLGPAGQLLVPLQPEPPRRDLTIDIYETMRAVGVVVFEGHTHYALVNFLKQNHVTL